MVATATEVVKRLSMVAAAAAEKAAVNGGSSSRNAALNDGD